MESQFEQLLTSCFVPETNSVCKMMLVNILVSSTFLSFTLALGNNNDQIASLTKSLLDEFTCTTMVTNWKWRMAINSYPVIQLDIGIKDSNEVIASAASTCKNFLFISDNTMAVQEFLEINKRVLKGDPARYAVLLTMVLDNNSILVLMNKNGSMASKLNNLVVFRPRSSVSMSLDGFRKYGSSIVPAGSWINGRFIDIDRKTSNVSPFASLQSQKTMIGQRLTMVTGHDNFPPIIFNTGLKNELGEAIYDGYEVLFLTQ